jgi:hypothetical protein
MDLIKQLEQYDRSRRATEILLERARRRGRSVRVLTLEVRLRNLAWVSDQLIERIRVTQ